MKYSNSNFSTTASRVKSPEKISAGSGDPKIASGNKVSGKGRPAPPDLLKYQRKAMYPLSSVVNAMMHKITRYDPKAHG